MVDDLTNTWGINQWCSLGLHMQYCLKKDSRNSLWPRCLLAIMIVFSLLVKSNTVRKVHVALVTIKCSWKKCRAVGSKVWGRFGGYKKAGHVLSGVFQKRLLTVSRSWNCEAQHIHCTEIAHGISFKNYKTMVEGVVRLPNEENGDASCTFHLGSRAGVSLWPSWEQSRGQ